jgi:hypothetical protein
VWLDLFQLALSMSCRFLRPFVGGLAVLWFAAPSSANERLGIVVHRLVDSCVGQMIQTPGVMERLARAGRTATSLCSCAAEAAIITSKLPEAGFDAWAADAKFRDLLTMCSNAGSR